MVEVVVRQQDEVDRRQVVDGQGGGCESLRTPTGQRADGLAKDRVDEDPAAVGMDQEGRMTQPSDSKGLAGHASDIERHHFRTPIDAITPGDLPRRLPQDVARPRALATVGRIAPGVHVGIAFHARP